MKTRVLISLFTLLLAGAAPAQDTTRPCHAEIPCRIGDRAYHVKEPDDWDGVTPLPVLLHFHGWQRTGALPVKHARISGATRRRGVLLLAPNGRNRTWDFWDDSSDDVAFAAAVIEDAAKRYPIDRTRIYVSGYSYGAAMAWRYVCENGDGVAALLAVSGSIGQSENCPQGPQQVRQVYGLADNVMPFPMGPGGDTTYPVALWRRQFGCGQGESAGTWQAVSFLAFQRTVWADCTDGGPVTLDVHPGGHFIPHGWIARQLDELLGWNRPIHRQMPWAQDLHLGTIFAIASGRQFFAQGPILMKFTLSWLHDHLETDAGLDEIVEALTDLGLEVEEVTNPAERLRDFTIGKVLHAEKHPEADRLKVCRVATDEGELQIICGAPNAREGITVVVAKPGTYVPGIDKTIGVGRIRGVESFGMMASEREMELSDEHDGIIELPAGSKGAEVGDRFTDWLAENDPAKVDPVIEIAITPNRPDALGVHGIARDLAARGLGTLKEHAFDPVPGDFPCPVPVHIDEDTADGCPLFTGRLIRGVKNGPSPQWLQDLLRAIGLRPISALVDITNFFTYDRNRPLHVFDAARLTGGLRIHRAAGGETLAALDDNTYTLGPGMMVISDDSGPQSIAGIIGGAATGVSDETTDVFLESAYWDNVQIALAGRALKVNSDARYRFERGVDPEFTLEGLELATRMILDLCGGEPSDVVIAGSVPDQSRAYKLDAARVQSLVGMDIPEAEQRQTLTRLGFRLEGNMAHVPSWRPDVQGEADLVEEVARMASLTRLEGRPLPRPNPGIAKPVMTPIQRREQAARRMCAALGYNECVSYSFIDQASAALFGGDGATRLENPISSEMSHMRPDLLPGLLQAAARNQARGFGDLALFEVGPAFHGSEPGDQHLQVAGLLVGRTVPKDVHGASRPVDVFDIKADAEAVLGAINAPAKVQILRGAPGWWHPGRHGRICLGPKKVLAVFGELHPKVLDAIGVRGPAMAFTIWPAEVPLPRRTGATRAALELRDLQAVERDFAFVVDENVEALALVNAAAGADKALIEDVRVFDEFVGGSLGEGKKSLAVTVRLQPVKATLKETDIEAVSAKIVARVAKATGGVLRG